MKLIRFVKIFGIRVKKPKFRHAIEKKICYDLFKLNDKRIKRI
ncbi:hypothetical protein EBA29_02386 [Bacillus velezensis]|uniref:Uncharacterized protein n=1 Tax=Bacillus amyloliquefaciens (strain Y2) TaxID=1155777 RepID=I2C7L5_BACAY|nr:hypothetical protein MUS_2730 [Bacillus velezensis YAU B9601-Y2]AGZ57042.1 hypothetical protein U471_23440 [Bacillus amyloliquefaciens CC178]KYC86775.1 hypothetical protein B4140_2454 [Bacillus amyloliquefaciens]QAR57412.1 hypothetical protein EBA29_02386 [Bacillus velezensis]QEY91217.1 hypothetical protein BACIT_3394 [Bacillus amyloliquefaciens]